MRLHTGSARESSWDALRHDADQSNEVAVALAGIFIEYLCHSVIAIYADPAARSVPTCIFRNTYATEVKPRFPAIDR